VAAKATALSEWRNGVDAASDRLDELTLSTLIANGPTT
jgi:hypothetical protein